MFNVFIQILPHICNRVSTAHVTYVTLSEVTFHIMFFASGMLKENCMLSRDKASKRNLNHKEVSLNENMQHNMTHVVVVETTKMISVVGLSCRHHPH